MIQLGAGCFPRVASGGKIDQIVFRRDAACQCEDGFHIGRKQKVRLLASIKYTRLSPCAMQGETQNARLGGIARGPDSSSALLVREGTTILSRQFARR